MFVTNGSQGNKSLLPFVDRTLKSLGISILRHCTDVMLSPEMCTLMINASLKPLT